MTVLTSWFGKSATSARRGQRLGKRRRLRLEPLETRALLAAFIVNTTADTVNAAPGNGVAVDAAGDTSLRAAVMEANALGGSHTIELDEGIYQLSITSSTTNDDASATDLDIHADITVVGAGAELTTIDAQQLFRIFHVHSGATLSVRDVTLTGGRVSITGDGGGGGGAVLVNSSGTLDLSDSIVDGNSGLFRGAIDVGSGSATIQRTAFSNNHAGSQGGAIASRSSTIEISDSLFHSNSASQAGGAMGILFTDVAVTNTTFSGNFVGSSPEEPSGSGGAISGSGTIDLTHVTITGNSASSGGGIDAEDQSTVTLTNSLVAENVSDSSDTSDVSGTIQSSGGNLISIYSAAALHPSDQLGSTTNPIDPLLGPLADNGGPTLTHALLRGSPAIEAALTLGNVDTDQRGLPRPVGQASDIGAYEVQPGDPGFNSAPTALDDFYTLLAGEALEVDTESGVLANDTDPEDDPLTALLVDGPQFGNLQLAADGSFAYTPDEGFVGTDNFTYRAFDGLLESNLALVTLEVTPAAESIAIDIQPGDDSNTIDLVDTWMTVAILGNDSLDVTQIDLNSLRFGARGTENSIERDGRGAKAAVVFDRVDLNGNGHLDLVVRFEIKRTKLKVGDSEATLTGAMAGGEQFSVSQHVNVVSSRGNPGRGNGHPGGGNGNPGRGNGPPHH